jgi:hypothetical protein
MSLDLRAFAYNGFNAPSVVRRLTMPEIPGSSFDCPSVVGLVDKVPADSREKTVSEMLGAVSVSDQS